jgi:hypothetical protein
MTNYIELEMKQVDLHSINEEIVKKEFDQAEIKKILRSIHLAINKIFVMFTNVKSFTRVFSFL